MPITEIILAANGESLTPEISDKIFSSGIYTIAIKDAFFKLKNPTMVYSHDVNWWDDNLGLPGYAGGYSQKVCSNEVPTVHACHPEVPPAGFFKTYKSDILIDEYYALKLVSSRADYIKRIILVGYDFSAPAGKLIDKIKMINALDEFNLLVKSIEKRGIDVYNCKLNDYSKHVFLKGNLDDYLGD